MIHVEINTLLIFNQTGEEKYVNTVYTIENMDRHKGGIYICTASNGVGQTASSQINLHVLCKYIIFHINFINFGTVIMITCDMLDTTTHEMRKIGNT